MAGSLKRLGLDTNVLIDRGLEKPFAVEFIDVFQKRGYSLEVPPTVIMELGYLKVNGEDRQKEGADKALQWMRAWGLSPVVLKDVEQSYKTNFITLAQEAGLLPPKEINDLHILAETAIAGIHGLVTSDTALLYIDQKGLNLTFEKCRSDDRDAG